MKQDAEGNELRRSTRSPIFLEGKIYLNNGRVEACKIKDLSVSGAKIEVRAGLELPETFDLVIFEVGSARTCRATLRWRRGNEAGISITGAK